MKNSLQKHRIHSQRLCVTVLALGFFSVSQANDCSVELQSIAPQLGSSGDLNLDPETQGVVLDLYYEAKEYCGSGNGTQALAIVNQIKNILDAQ